MPRYSQRGLVRDVHRLDTSGEDAHLHRPGGCGAARRRVLSVERPTPFDLQRIVEVLDRHGVDYLLVGGVAAQVYGATRPTRDFDCLASFEGGNLDRLCSALRELGARVRAEGVSDDEARAVAAAMLHPDTFRRVQVSNWMTDAGAVDVLHDMPGRGGERLGFEQLMGRSTVRLLSGVRVRVAALDDVVASKEFVNRAKDRAALPELRALQVRERETPGQAPEPPDRGSR